VVEVVEEVLVGVNVEKLDSLPEDDWRPFELLILLIVEGRFLLHSFDLLRDLGLGLLKIGG
jgi:hypothetical protein